MKLFENFYFQIIYRYIYQTSNLAKVYLNIFHTIFSAQAQPHNITASRKSFENQALKWATNRPRN